MMSKIDYDSSEWLLDHLRNAVKSQPEGIADSSQTESEPIPGQLQIDLALRVKIQV